MKKLLIFLVLLAGCAKSETKIDENDRLQLKGDVYSYPINTFEYDGCEYIAVGQGTGLSVTHKGNCKYCRERANEKNR
jgi:hypothetical protein